MATWARHSTEAVLHGRKALLYGGRHTRPDEQRNLQLALRSLKVPSSGQKYKTSEMTKITGVSLLRKKNQAPNGHAAPIVVQSSANKVVSRSPEPTHGRRMASARNVRRLRPRTRSRPARAGNAWREKTSKTVQHIGSDGSQVDYSGLYSGTTHRLTHSSSD